MENLILFLATSLLFRVPSVRKVSIQLIGSTGCSALLATDDVLESSVTASGDQLYFHEFKEKNVGYGLICVQLNTEHTIEETEVMLRSYVDKLRDPMCILHNTGIDDDADWNSENSRTIVDYWQDREQRDWKVKGYTNGKVLAVLYVKNIGHTDVKKQDDFLDSFHFGPVHS
jgi:hypothetical protein